MDILVKHYEALFNLLFGVTYAVTAVLVLVKHRSIVGMAMALWVGVVFAVLGRLELQGCIDEGWVRASALAGALSLVSIIKRIFRISSGARIDCSRCRQ